MEGQLFGLALGNARPSERFCFFCNIAIAISEIYAGAKGRVYCLAHIRTQLEAGKIKVQEVEIYKGRSLIEDQQERRRLLGPAFL